VLTLEASTGRIEPTGSLTLLAGKGIILLDDLLGAVAERALVIDPDYELEGDGTLTVTTGKTLNTNRGELTVTAWDVDLDGSISSGTAVVRIHGSKVVQTIGLGTTTTDMDISDAELQRIVGPLIIGSSNTGSVYVNGVTRDMLTIIASRDDAQVQFFGSSSTFSTIGVQADNGIAVDASVNTVTGALYLNADVEDDIDGDSPNALQVATGKTLSAKTQLILEATDGSLVSAGTLTMLAGKGILLRDNLFGAETNKALVINSDYEVAGDGTLTVVTGKTVTSNSGEVTITAWDIDFLGGVSSGTQSIKIHGSKIGQTIGLGGTAKNMHISNAELQRLNAGGLVLGGNSGGSITVNGITAAGSNSVSGEVSLVALADNVQVLVETSPSTFNIVSMHADNGVVIKADITADAGSMYINGDVENSSSEDSINTVGATDGRTIKAKTVLTLQAKMNGILPAGTLSLLGGKGIVLLDSLTGGNNNMDLVINADYEIAGDGAFTITATKTVTSNDSRIILTAWDVDLSGGITPGTKAMSIHGSKVAQTVGLGGTPTWTRDMHINDTGQLFP
jgi:hypothetical protein